jgi:hypothetical protein
MIDTGKKGVINFKIKEYLKLRLKTFLGRYRNEWNFLMETRKVLLVAKKYNGQSYNECL